MVVDSICVFVCSVAGISKTGTSAANGADVDHNNDNDKNSWFFMNISLSSWSSSVTTLI